MHFLGHIALARMINIRTDHNLFEIHIDAWTELFKEYFPEENMSVDSYYKVNKLVYSLGLHAEMIDFCISDSIIYWKGDEKLIECCFCKKPRFKFQGRGLNSLPY